MSLNEFMIQMMNNNWLMFYSMMIMMMINYKNINKKNKSNKLKIKMKKN